MSANQDLQKLIALHRPLPKRSLQLSVNSKTPAQPTPKAVYQLLKKTFSASSWELHAEFSNDYRSVIVTIRLHLFGQWLEQCASSTAEECGSEFVEDIFETALVKAGMLWGIGDIK